jgi:hypothetical protein
MQAQSAADMGSGACASCVAMKRSGSDQFSAESWMSPLSD